MAETQSCCIDLRSGYCRKTKIFHSLRQAVPMPPPSEPLSIISYTLSLLYSSTNTASAALSTTSFLIDAATGSHLTYTAFLHQVDSLSSSIRSLYPNLSVNDVAFIISPPSLHVPVLYFSLLSLGITVSPANPLSSPEELAHQIKLSKPSIAFAATATAHKLPGHLPVILLDSHEFFSMLSSVNNSNSEEKFKIKQSDPAAILYSSGTTGKVKAVVLSHRNFIAMIAGLYYNKLANEEQGKQEMNMNMHPANLFTVPLFHVYGFFMLLRAAALGESVVLMEKFDFVKMLEAVERYRVTFIPVTPPLVVAMVKSDLVAKYDLSSLRSLGCGGAPLGKEVLVRFEAKFPNVDIGQGYGLTETTGAATRAIGPDEAKRYGSVGRLSENLEAKIVDPENGEALPPGKHGELWLRGPIIMKGYAGDDGATTATLDSEGWLKTGDLCYFDSDGFLFIVDRLKELIKYKAYQVPPAELEHLLQSIPEIEDAAVIPYPDEEAGQIPMAYIVRKPGNNITSAQIMDLIAKQACLFVFNFYCKSFS
ncbi:4-coumarate-- ligase-like 9 [Olea europaea subsp. europaea]|uniref:4-coumarate-- ligase-like 9 n=1 Tax=Olea europaea subsp. europaea TaxID=158383 RepID=A0A8S0TER6_OLEEU|nr:4-coumarate-- ligase-like 9 [Olea europaea subsp. europaea]